MKSIIRGRAVPNVLGVVIIALTLGLVLGTDALPARVASAQTPTVTVQKVLVTPDGTQVTGADLSGYTFSVTPVGTTTPINVGPTNASGVASLVLPAGTYTITEQARAGATLQGFAIGGAPIGAPTGIFQVPTGSTTPITITATNQVAGTGSIVITKQIVDPAGAVVTGADLSGFSFLVTGPGGFNQTQMTTATGVVSFFNLAAGQYSITEMPRAGTTFVAASIDGVPVPNGQPFQLFAGETRQVLFQNQVGGTGTIRITKELVDVNNAVVAGDRSNFQFTVVCGTAFSQVVTTDVNGVASVPNAPVGSCTITEAGRTGFTLVSIVPQGGVDVGQGGAVTVTAGGTTEVRVRNRTAGGGTVRVTKEIVDVNNQVIATADRSNFQFTIVCGTAFSQVITSDVNGVAAASNVPAGNCVITEAARAGFTLVSIVPAGGVDVGSGGTITVAANQTLEVRVRNRSGTAPQPATEPVALFPGCNNQALTWAAGTAMTTVAAGVTPPGILLAIWYYDAAQARFLGFSPNPLAPSDYVATRTSLDAAFICVSANGTLNRPVR